MKLDSQPYPEDTIADSETNTPSLGPSKGSDLQTPALVVAVLDSATDKR